MNNTTEQPPLPLSLYNMQNAKNSSCLTQSYSTHTQPSTGISASDLSTYQNIVPTDFFPGEFR